MGTIYRFLSRSLRVGLYALLGLCLMLGSSVWWLPALLPRCADFLGLELASVTQLEGGRWQLRQIEYPWQAGVVSIDTVELPAVHTYLLERWRGEFTEGSAVQLSGLRVDLRAQDGAVGSPGAPVALAERLQGWRSGLDAMRAWLPTIRVAALRLNVDGESRLRISQLQLDAASCHALLQFSGAEAPIEVWGEFGEGQRWSATVHTQACQLQAQMDFAADGVRMQAELSRGAERLTAAAHYSMGQELPDQVSLHSEGFTLNLAELGLLPKLEISELSMQQLELKWELAGEREARQGQFHLAVGEVADLSSRFPSLRKLKVDGSVDAEWVRLEQMSVTINQGQLSAHGTLELAAIRNWRSGALSWREAFLPKAVGTLRLERCQLSDWSAYLPAQLRQTGEFFGHLNLSAGAQLEGVLTFKEIGLRPSDVFTSVDSIQGELILEGRRITLAAASAQVGGSPLQLAGQLDLSQLEAPSWDFRLRGSNLPLVRSSKMIVRSDVDLQALSNSAAVQPILQGRLDLRASTLLVDFDPLAAELQVGPRRQPPYFSVSHPLFNDWLLDLKLQGDSFLQVRSAYFRTALSADLALSGTLGGPVLLGSVRSVGGEIRFPGARMQLEQGEAYIEPGQPHAVQLSASGSAQTASYVIGMEVLGTVAKPVIQFQSSPVLTNAQIVQLLATGSLTGGGAGTVGLYLGQGLLGAGGFEDGIADRLTVEVGNGKTRSGRSTVESRYDLSEDWYLEGGYDVYDAYNLDLIWSIFRR